MTLTQHKGSGPRRCAYDSPEHPYGNVISGELSRQKSNVKMQNDRGVNVELFTPRKCSATNRLIKPKDHAAVQINIAKLNDEGKMVQGEFHTYSLSGPVRAQGEADDSLNRLAQEDGLLSNVFSYTR